MILQVDAIRTHVETLEGNGESLLLMHGWGPASVSLEKHLLPLGRMLSDRYRVTMVDFPGHGDSGMPDGNWGVPEYAEWTLKVMDQLAIRQTALVAHSFGGRVALWLAAHHPERVSRMVLTGCAGIRPKRGLNARLRTLVFKAGRTGVKAMALIPKYKLKADKWLNDLRAEFASSDYLATPEPLRGSFSQVVRRDLRPLLPKIEQPVLLVWGGKDSATPLWMGEMMRKLMPDARLLVYLSDDHWAYKNQLARFYNAVDIFLGEGRG